MKHFSRMAFVCILWCFSGQAFAQTTFYNIQSVQKIELFFQQTNWDYMLDTAKLGVEGYLKADSARINGTKFPDVGVKYKGNSSYDSSFAKNPYTIKLDKYVSQNYQGVKSIKLANCYDDPSMIREVMSYKMLSNYMHCPRSNFTQVYVNGVYKGVYSNDEDVTKPFVLSHFYSSGNTFIKCSPLLASPANKSNLKYVDTYTTSYTSNYEMESSAASGWTDLIALCDSVTNKPANIASVIDIDRAIWMLAFNNALVNLDSYSGVFAQNYFLYKDNTGHYNPIMWDMNMSLGGFNFSGTPGFGMGTMTLANMQQLVPDYHATHADWPLIKAIMSNAMYKRMYMAHFRTIVNELFAEGYYETLAADLKTTVSAAVLSDPNKFFSNADFQNGMTADVTVNGRVVPGIKNLMSARVTFLQSNADFILTAPVISKISCSNFLPSNGSVVQMSVTATNATAVYFAYRNDSTLKFSRTAMFDDGLHNDGAANDQVYGISFTMGSDYAQYYVYAENASAGLFSPARAEHEFYDLPGSAPVISGINEQSTFLTGNIQVYPNPANDVVYIKPASKEKIMVMNMVGEVVYESEAKELHELNTASWSCGAYLVKCGSSVSKLVIAR
jgi:hypothetical protein